MKMKEIIIFVNENDSLFFVNLQLGNLTIIYFYNRYFFGVILTATIYMYIFCQ